MEILVGSTIYQQFINNLFLPSTIYQQFINNFILRCKITFPSTLQAWILLTSENFT